MSINQTIPNNMLNTHANLGGEALLREFLCRQAACDHQKININT